MICAEMNSTERTEKTVRVCSDHLPFLQPDPKPLHPCSCARISVVQVVKPVSPSRGPSAKPPRRLRPLTPPPYVGKALAHPPCWTLEKSTPRITVVAVLPRRHRPQAEPRSAWHLPRVHSRISISCDTGVQQVRCRGGRVRRIQLACNRMTQPGQAAATRLDAAWQEMVRTFLAPTDSHPTLDLKEAIGNVNCPCDQRQLITEYTGSRTFSLVSTFIHILDSVHFCLRAVRESSGSSAWTGRVDVPAAAVSGECGQ